MKKLIIDASIAAKWQLLSEPEAEKALSILMDYVEFWTGDRKLYNAISGKFPYVRWIGDYVSS